MDAAILVVRLVVGLAIAAHGTQKLFGWFGGYGFQGTSGFMESLGFRPGSLFTLAAGVGEVASGLLVALGLFGPVGPALLIAVMTVAIVTVHLSHGFFADKNGVELPLLYAIGALAVAFAGPGAYSLDALLGVPAASPRLTWLLVAVGVLGGLAQLALRRPAAVEARA